MAVITIISNTIRERVGTYFFQAIIDNGVSWKQRESCGEHFLDRVIRMRMDRFSMQLSPYLSISQVIMILSHNILQSSGVTLMCIYFYKHMNVTIRLSQSGRSRVTCKRAPSISGVMVVVPLASSNIQ